jgi:hypothetical protein
MGGAKLISESSQAGGGGTLSRQGGQLPANTLEQTTGVYKVAFEESVRALEDQVEELTGIRQRLVGYLGFVGAATAFLVGSSLRPQVGGPTDRDAWFYVLAISGTSLMVVSIVCAIFLLWPRLTKLSTTASAKLIIGRHIERELSPVQSESELYRSLALYNDGAVDENDTVLERARKFYFGAIVVGALQLCVWVVLVWHSA